MASYCHIISIFYHKQLIGTKRNHFNSPVVLKSPDTALRKFLLTRMVSIFPSFLPSQLLYDDEKQSNEKYSCLLQFLKLWFVYFFFTPITLENWWFSFGTILNDFIIRLEFCSRFHRFRKPIPNFILIFFLACDALWHNFNFFKKITLKCFTDTMFRKRS